MTARSPQPGGFVASKVALRKALVAVDIACLLIGKWDGRVEVLKFSHF